MGRIIGNVYGTPGDRFRITHEVISHQLESLARRPTSKRMQNHFGEDTRAACLLKWQTNRDPTEGNDEATSLGLLSRWLLLLDVVFEIKGKDVDLELEVFPKKVRNARKKGGKVQTDSKKQRKSKPLMELFAPFPVIGARRFQVTLPHRYDPTQEASDAEDDKNRKKALQSLISIISEFHLQQGLSPLTAEEFVKHQAELQPGAPQVGLLPLQRFRAWLKYKMDLPNCAYIAPSSLDHHQHLVEMENQILRCISENSGPRIICNFTLAEINQLNDQHLKCLCGSLTSSVNFSSADRKTRASRISEMPLTAFYIDLKNGLSPSNALKQLYAQTGLRIPELEPNSENESTLKAVRYIRSWLTASRFVLVVRHTEGTPEPFLALKEYISGSPWSEILRILAQPDRKFLQIANESLQQRGRIVIFSKTEIKNLDPWLAFSTPFQWTGDSYIREMVPASPRLIADQAYGDLILRFVACSINGLNVSSLRWCLIRWVRTFGWTPDLRQRGAAENSDQTRIRVESACRWLEDIGNWSKTFSSVVDKYGNWLFIDVSDEAANGVAMDDGELSAAVPPKNRVRFSSRECLEEYFRGWQEAAIAHHIHAIDVANSEHIHFILAEEALLRATLEGRHLIPGRAAHDPTIRRFMEAILHGLACASLVVPELANEKTSLPSFKFSALPPEPNRRYRFLYSFLYRQGVEAGNWQLGRAFGHSDVRLAILLLFLVPKNAKGLFLEAPLETLVPAIYTPEVQLPVDDWALRSDMLLALGRAGLDSGLPIGKQATAWAISVLPGWRLPPAMDPIEWAKVEGEDATINSRLPPRGHGYEEIANEALKLRVDLLQSSGSGDQVKIAKMLCYQQLHRLGIDSGLLRKLRKDVYAVLEMAFEDEGSVTEKLQAKLKEAYSSLLVKDRGYENRVLIADIVHRLAELAATIADNIDSFPLAGLESSTNRTLLLGRKDSVLESTSPLIGRYAEAVALFWIADRIRGSAADEADAGVRWPSAGTKPMRYYVRVCLVLARMISEESAKGSRRRPRDLARSLVELAESRLELFTRHYFRFERERAASLLLESARLRSVAQFYVRDAKVQFLTSMATILKKEKTLKEGLERLRSELKKERFALNNFESKNPTLKGSSLHVRYVNNVRQLEDRQTVKGGELDELRSSIPSIAEELKRAIRRARKTLDQVRNCLDSAEDIFISIGFRRGHVKRLLLERVKVESSSLRVLFQLLDDSAFKSHLGADEAQLMVALVDSVLDCVERLTNLKEVTDLLRSSDFAMMSLEGLVSGDPFWEEIYRRQVQSRERLLADVFKVFPKLAVIAAMRTRPAVADTTARQLV